MMRHNIPRAEQKIRTLKLLEAANIADRAISPLNISGGERPRVAIAEAIANESKIIIEIEPTGNLDLKARLSDSETDTFWRRYHE